MKKRPTTFHIVTIFPDIVDSYVGESMLKRARNKKLIDVKFYNPRDFARDKHKTVDDKPYGGGPGMVMLAEPILKAVEKAKRSAGSRKTKTIILSPRGKEFTNAYASRLAKNAQDIILIAGHYEGIDARVKKILKAEEVSIGPYTLTGGEVPAMVVVDAVARQIPGVLGKGESVEEKRTASGEVYSRPEVLKYKDKNHKVPSVLLSGHHGKVEEWRKGKSGRK